VTFPAFTKQLQELSQTYEMNVKKWSEGPFINA